MEAERAAGSRGRYIAITGAIAAGASTLANALNEHLGWRRYEEASPHRHNAFFVDASRDFLRWGSFSQLHFATASAERHMRLRKTLADWREGDLPIVEERTPFEHHEAYVRAYHRFGLIETREADLLNRIAMIFSQAYVVPDLLIYRRVRRKDMIRRIQERQRPGEVDVDPDLLEAIDVAFQEMVDNWTRSPIFVLDAEIDLLDIQQAEKIVAEIKTLVAD